MHNRKGATRAHYNFNWSSRSNYHRVQTVLIEQTFLEYYHVSLRSKLDFSFCGGGGGGGGGDGR